MSGVAVVRWLLANHPALTAEVPATRIFGGPAPLKTTLPAITVMHISGMPTVTVANNSTKRLHEDRVQVMVHVKDYAEKGPLLALVMAACTGRQGTTNGVDLDAIVPDLEGPDLDEPAEVIFRRSRDFKVRWRST